MYEYRTTGAVVAFFPLSLFISRCLLISPYLLLYSCFLLLARLPEFVSRALTNLAASQQYHRPKLEIKRCLHQFIFRIKLKCPLIVSRFHLITLPLTAAMDLSDGLHKFLSLSLSLSLSHSASLFCSLSRPLLHTPLHPLSHFVFLPLSPISFSSFLSV